MVLFLVLPLFSLLLHSIRAGNASPPLTQLKVNPDTLAVSGFSSGGCFATQFHTAFSSSVQGMGSFSGCPYLWAGADGNVEDIIMTTRELALMGAIDPLEGLAEDQVYIFQGHLDPIVPWGNAGHIHAFYSSFTTEENIEEKSDLLATHGMPSDSYGCKCGVLCPYFYINNCHYNGAEAVLRKTLPYELPSLRTEAGNLQTFNQEEQEQEEELYNLATIIQEKQEQELYNLTTFDQEEFYGGEAGNYSMAGEGFVYVPQRCAGGQVCHLHVHFHGCGMGSNWLEDNYIQHSGFLAQAQQNDVIMLFPQIAPLESAGNANGCWDWWGYLGDSQDFAYEHGVHHLWQCPAFGGTGTRLFSSVQ